jgi:hypothetical protein
VMSDSRVLLAFTVNERPRPKGSLTGMSARNTTRVRMKESVDPVGVFRTAVARAAFLACWGRPAMVRHYSEIRPLFDEAKFGQGVTVETAMRFRFSRKPGHGLWAPADVIGKRLALAVGDEEKLVRNVHDALMDAGVLADDHQVSTGGRVAKRFADEDAMEVPGVDVLVLLDDEDGAYARDDEVFGEVFGP